MMFTFALPWSILALATAASLPVAWLLVLISFALRLVIMVVSGFFVLRDRQVFRSLWLIPIRDFITLAVWILSYTGSSVVWRGNKFELSNGKLRPA